MLTRSITIVLALILVGINIASAQDPAVVKLDFKDVTYVHLLDCVGRQTGKKVLIQTDLINEIKISYTGEKPCAEVLKDLEKVIRQSIEKEYNKGGDKEYVAEVHCIVNGDTIVVTGGVDDIKNIK